MSRIYLLLLLAGTLLINLACSSCEPSWREFYRDALYAQVDSVRIRGWGESARTFDIQVGEKWYTLRSDIYTDFSEYVAKGDSVYKEPGQWDITVKRRRGSRVIEKYFRGAQDYWD